MTLEKLELEIDKTHTLYFKVVISGQNIFSKSKINFIITEINSRKEWIFPSSKDKHGIIEVDIPIMKDMFSFTKIYLGELKAVVENRVFYPVRVNIIFVDSNPSPNKGRRTHLRLVK